jgi:glycosyltransferase involved in cell wall biosynthesis
VEASVAVAVEAGKISLVKILFITKHYLPRIGGVEKQVSALSKRLIKKGHKVAVLTLKYDKSLKNKENIDGVEVIRINIPEIKYIGLLYIWLWCTIYIEFFDQFDVIHTHGVFIWCWPLRFLLPQKPFYTTFHGWEGIYPIPLKNKLIRKIDSALAWGNITISDYVEKWYGIKADILSYTAVDIPEKKNFKKNKKSLLYVGRLDRNTGLPKLLKALENLDGFRVDFCGDGELKSECEKRGIVHGFTNPNPFYEKAFICLSPGVTSILEAFTYKCLIVTTYDSPVKKDYLLMNPFSKWIVVEDKPEKLAEKIKYYSKNDKKAEEKINMCYDWVKTQSWTAETKKYLRLWKVRKTEKEVV